ncbi:MAG: hypothetical protein PHG42_05160 [Bacteroides sp.]|nr:hypothetical protein [Bacteroides sp.]
MGPQFQDDIVVASGCTICAGCMACIATPTPDFELTMVALLSE